MNTLPTCQNKKSLNADSSLTWCFSSLLLISFFSFASVVSASEHDQSSQNKCLTVFDPPTDSNLSPAHSISQRADELIRFSQKQPIYSEPFDSEVKFEDEQVDSSEYKRLGLIDSLGNPVPGYFNNLKLSLENGSQPLKTIRIHLPSAKKNPNISSLELTDFEELRSQQFLLLLKDLTPLLDQQNGIHLNIVYPKTRGIEAEQLVEMQFGKDFSNSRVHFVEHTERFFELGPWAQDDSKPLQNGQSLAPSRYDLKPRLLDKEVLPVLANLQNQGANRFLPGKLPFEGGDIVVGDRHVFVGAKQVADVAQSLNISITKAQKLYELEFSKPVFLVGEISRHSYPKFGEQKRGVRVRQIDYHSDLTLAIGRVPMSADEVVFLASHERAREAVLQMLTSIKSSANRLTPAEAQALEKPLNLAELFLKTSYKNREAHNNNLKNRLTRLGYRVLEVPTFTLPDLQNFDFPKYINYTNAVFSGDIVLVAELGIPFLDAAAHQVYRSAGFKVIAAKHSSWTYLQSCGGPRCAMNTMR